MTSPRLASPRGALYLWSAAGRGAVTTDRAAGSAWRALPRRARGGPPWWRYAGQAPHVWTRERGRGGRGLQPDAATQPHRTPEGAHSGARATDDLSCLCGHASWAGARFRSMSRGIDLPSSRLLRAEVRCAARTPELCAGKVGDRCHQRRGKPANPESGNRHFAPGWIAAAAGVRNRRA
eukprot:COSAG06_NODE_11076_length_1571_cov_37.860054_1_plen_179_part_00